MKNSVAVITGASQGIAYGYAKWRSRILAIQTSRFGRRYWALESRGY
jgi:NADP-dependent 3-hydroxy acid dehydrogenase YdfG